MKKSTKGDPYGRRLCRLRRPARRRGFRRNDEQSNDWEGSCSTRRQAVYSPPLGKRPLPLQLDHPRGGLARPAHARARSHARRGPWLFALVAAFAMLAAACHRGGNGARSEAPLDVHVVQAVRESVPITKQYVGATQAVKTVVVRARVRGYLEKALFREGSDVKAGALLFVIEQAPYRAALDQALADVAKAKAAAENARQQWRRVSALFKRNVASQSDLDSATATRDEAEAQVKAAQAALEQAKLDFSYTEVRSPLSGRVGRNLVDVGNLVGASSDTELTTVVQLDPIYVYFSPPERDRIEVLEKRQEGLYVPRSQVQVQAFLAGGMRFPHPGHIDFVDNTVNPADGTVRIRAVFPNPEKLLLPGQFADVHVLLGQQPAVLVPERAIIEEQGSARVLLVGPDEKVESRTVKAGGTANGMRIIESGLKPGERVLVDNLQRARPGMKVAVQEEPGGAHSGTPPVASDPKRD
jgi:RND family efflux transporter MFP subunit